MFWFQQTGRQTGGGLPSLTAMTAVTACQLQTEGKCFGQTAAASIDIEAG